MLDVANIFARQPARAADPPVPASLEARRALDLADRVLASVRATFRRPTAAPRPPPENAEVWLAPALAADYDAAGRLVVRSGWIVPGTDALIPPDAATPESIAEGGFGRDAAGTWHILASVPERLRAAFAAPAPRVVEGDAIPAALAALAAEPLARPSARVRATRVLEAPALARVEVLEGAPGWLELDALYAAGGHEIPLAQVLRAAGARWLRLGDDFVAFPSGPLLDEARAAFAGADPSAIPHRIPLRYSAYLRALAGEPGAPPPPPPPPAPLPRGYTGTLRPHQRAGLDWVFALRRAGLGGILADEMGLGKTHVSLALLAAAVEDGAAAPSLVVAPTSVVDAWIERARAFAPGLAPVRYSGPGRAAALEGLGPRSLVVTSYGILVRDAAALSAIEWEVAILDEAHRVKNAETEVAGAARQLKGRTRLCLTGTPIENRPGEIRALLEFCVPGYLPPPDRFEELERAIAAGDAAATDRLRRLVRPFKLRRLKRDVMPDLPRKSEETRYCELSPEQAAIYREVLADARSKLRGGAGLIPLLAAITRLKRICDHPALALPDGTGAALASGKLELFLEALGAALAEEKKIVVFSQYLQMMDLIEARLAALGVGFADLRGATRDRAGAIRRFQEDPACRVIVVSLLAGGVGIDLTSATVVVHYDRWWNAAREDQATDRVHRIGQTRDVSILKLVTRGTLEERIDCIIASKARLLDDIVAADDPAAMRALDREDVAALLE